MKKHILLKSVALFISWLTISPLLLILDGQWKLLPKWLRILLFFLSPLMLIVFAVTVIICYFYYYDYYYPGIISLGLKWLKTSLALLSQNIRSWNIGQAKAGGKEATRSPLNSKKYLLRISTKNWRPISIVLSQGNTVLTPSGGMA